MFPIYNTLQVVRHFLAHPVMSALLPTRPRPHFKRLSTLRRYALFHEVRRSLQQQSGLCYHKSQPFYQRYKSILPTSLTHIVLIDQRLLTLETCCGLWYGLDPRRGLHTQCNRLDGFSSSLMRMSRNLFGRSPLRLYYNLFSE